MIRRPSGVTVSERPGVSRRKPQTASGSMSDFDFDCAFAELTGNPPFPWQRRLFAEWFSRGELPPAIEIPTGLGKTSVMAVWLLARASGAPLPRRLAHVVDRHSVADHATELAEDLRERLGREALEPVRRGLGLTGRALPISTPRGRFADDREWMADPSAPAIVVGSVETVGTRLLFEGHGLSRSLRPYAAGLLGCDTLMLLDEADGSQAFEALLRSIETGQHASGAEPGTGVFAGRPARDALPPRLRVLPLSASPRAGESEAFGLDAEDRKNEIVRRRLHAEKLLTVEDLADGAKLGPTLAERAWETMRRETVAAGKPVRIAVYCDSRRDAAQIAADLRKRSKKEEPRPAVIVLGADRRVREQGGTRGILKEHGLLADGGAAPGFPVFLVAAAEGEAGADLDADHMVCDLVAWDRMVRRLGRVNRRGLGRARVLAIDRHPRSGGTEREAVRALIAALPRCAAGEASASPAALAGLGREQIRAASTRPPLYPALTRPLLDSWAMTSLADHPGRPAVGPWLRGWAKRRESPTTVLWRRYLPECMDDTPPTARRRAPDEAAAFFEAAPPQTAEGLETDAGLAADWIQKRARKLLQRLEPGTGVRDGAMPDADTPVALILDSANRPSGSLSPTAILELSTRELGQRLAGRFLVVDARLGGLDDGLLNDRSDRPVFTIEDGWGGDPGESPPPFRIRERTGADRRVRSAFPAFDRWRETLALPYRFSRAGEIETWLVVEKPPGGGEGEDALAVAPEEQMLADHQARAADEAARIARLLGLEEGDRAMLVAAARRHDEGKRAPRWQRAFGAEGGDAPRGKAPGPVNLHVLNGYRHELKSALDAEDAGLGGIPRSDPRFDLALHLIASHHGEARPTIALDGYDDMPPSAVEARAREIAARFARLQRQWGPWGLAWWEALLRGADRCASRIHELGAAPPRSERGAAERVHDESLSSASTAAE